MSSKNYTDVIIGGKVFTLGGMEEEEYLQKVAAYLNNKYDEYRHVAGFTRMAPENQAVLIQLNVADDYFQARERLEALEEQVQQMEKEAYELKHELISTQMKREVLEEKLNMLTEEVNSRKKSGS